jgi:hypothetical protein
MHSLRVRELGVMDTVRDAFIILATIVGLAFWVVQR